MEFKINLYRSTQKSRNRLRNVLENIHEKFKKIKNLKNFKNANLNFMSIKK